MRGSAWSMAFRLIAQEVNRKAFGLREISASPGCTMVGGGGALLARLAPIQPTSVNALL